MNLLIDIGNTRIKFGYALATGERCVQHTLAVIPQDLDQFVPWLQHHGLQPKRALLISVAKADVEQQVLQVLQGIGCDIIWLDATQPCDRLRNGYDQPSQLGADRWLSLIGVLVHHHALARPIVHASFGTATTVDTIRAATSTESALFQGGLILPGPQLMYEALATKTAKLGQGSGMLLDFPTHTRAAISTGIAAAQAGAVLRQWQLALDLGLGVPLLVCSGGGWALIQTEMEQAYQQRQRQLQLTPEALRYQPTPVLDGLAYMATQC